ncbi:class I SAM-dependent methyltransferase [Clostridium sp. ZBS13]|uniref:class I SAM-dependent methyltransferase n=1 Tax=Clostridium sp. ZBS13 TaxID=2949971 RepID=UPI0020799F0C|nr:class I SAM-dependent methyltransferase [Clostridium sp. ZBS13]
MEKKFMSALICAFSRAYHAKENEVKIFDDTIAELLLSKEEYNEIGENMSCGIKFFNPKFVGSQDEALRWIVDDQLSSSPLGRAAYAEKMLKNAVCVGKAKQYLIFAAGYDSFAYRQPQWVKEIEIFEIDHPVTASDKMDRLKKAHLEIHDNVNYVVADFTQEKWIESLTKNKIFDRNKISFCSVLGLSYYLSKTDFEGLIKAIGEVIPKGSSLVFEYPDYATYANKVAERTKKQVMLANEANEKMLAGYSYDEMEKLLCKCGFLIYEYLTPKQITEQYFEEYNKANSTHYMSAFDNVNYCLAVRQ